MVVEARSNLSNYLKANCTLWSLSETEVSFVFHLPKN